MFETREQRTKDMKKQARDMIEQVYQRGVKVGQDLAAEGKRELLYQGRNEAWEAARELYQFDPNNNKQLCEEIFDMGFNEMICTITASEAIEKLKAWEKKQNENNIIAGYDEYKDIKDTFIKLLDKGYTKAMLNTVLEQTKMEGENGKG